MVLTTFEVIAIAAGIAYVGWMSWPVKPKPRCRVCGYLSAERICSEACRARLSLVVISDETRDLIGKNFDEFGF